MAASSEFRGFVADLLAGLGDVRVRSMFGGAGIYHRDVMFGLIADDTLYFRIDELTEPRYAAEGMSAFSYTTAGRRRVGMPYRAVPDRLFDDSEELVQWAQQACEAASRSRTAARRKR